MAGRLNADPLFVGLTRPTMIFGVSIQYAILNMIGSGVAFVLSTSIYVLMIAVVIHSIGYILCFKEPRFVELYTVKAAKCSKCPNKNFYGANSYSV